MSTKNEPAQPVTQGDALLSFRKVAATVDLSRSTVYAMMAAGRFPRPVKLSTRCVRWRSSDVSAWVAKQA
jgi:prophage regulatory protein